MKFVAQCGCGLTLQLERPTYAEALAAFRKLGWEFTVDGSDWCPAHNTITDATYVVQDIIVPETDKARVSILREQIQLNEQALKSTKEYLQYLTGRAQVLQRRLLEATKEESHE